MTRQGKAKGVKEEGGGGGARGGGVRDEGRLICLLICCS